MKKQKNKNRFKKIVMALIAVFLVCFLISMYLLLSFPLYSKVFDVKFQVGDRIGVTVNSTIVDYGIVLKDTASERIIELENNFDFPLKAEVLVSSSIRDYIFSMPKFYMMPKEKMNYSLILSVQDAEYGNYSGKIKFNFYKQE